MILYASLFIIIAASQNCVKQSDCTVPEKKYCHILGDLTGECRTSVQKFILGDKQFYYQYFEWGLVYKEAEKACRKRNGTLAIMTSNLENRAAWASMGKLPDDWDPVYFGFNECQKPEDTEDKGWKFDSYFTSSTYTAWSEGEPNDFCGTDEECGAYLPNEKDFKWFDVACGSESAYICSIFGEDFDGVDIKAEHCENTEFDFAQCFSIELVIASLVMIIIAFALQIVGCSCFLEKAQLGVEAQEVEPLYCSGCKKVKYTNAFMAWLIIYTLLHIFAIIGSVFWCYDFFCVFPNLIRLLALCFYAYGYNSICSENSLKAKRFLFCILIEAGLFGLVAVLLAATTGDFVLGLIMLVSVALIYPLWYYLWSKMANNFAEKEGWAGIGTVNLSSGTTGLQNSSQS